MNNLNSKLPYTNSYSQKKVDKFSTLKAEIDNQLNNSTNTIDLITSNLQFEKLTQKTISSIRSRSKSQAHAQILCKNYYARIWKKEFCNVYMKKNGGDSSCNFSLLEHSSEHIFENILKEIENNKNYEFLMKEFGDFKIKNREEDNFPENFNNFNTNQISTKNLDDTFDFYNEIMGNNVVKKETKIEKIEKKLINNENNEKKLFPRNSSTLNSNINYHENFINLLSPHSIKKNKLFTPNLLTKKINNKNNSNKFPLSSHINQNIINKSSNENTNSNLNQFSTSRRLNNLNSTPLITNNSYYPTPFSNFSNNFLDYNGVNSNNFNLNQFSQLQSQTQNMQMQTHVNSNFYTMNNLNKNSNLNNLNYENYESNFPFTVNTINPLNNLNHQNSNNVNNLMSINNNAMHSFLNFSENNFLLPNSQYSLIHNRPDNKNINNQLYNIKNNKENTNDLEYKIMNINNNEKQDKIISLSELLALKDMSRIFKRREYNFSLQEIITNLKYSVNNLIFPKIKMNIIELSTHQFANYIIQKMVVYLNDDNIEYFFEKVSS